MKSHVEFYGEVKLDDDGFIRLNLPCLKCGYELRGLRPQGRCPECGASIKSSIASPRPPMPERILIKVNCIALLCTATTYLCLWTIGPGGRRDTGVLEFVRPFVLLCVAVSIITCLISLRGVWQWRNSLSVFGLTISLALLYFSYQFVAFVY